MKFNSFALVSVRLLTKIEHKYLKEIIAFDLQTNLESKISGSQNISSQDCSILAENVTNINPPAPK